MAISNFLNPAEESVDILEDKNSRSYEEVLEDVLKEDLGLPFTQNDKDDKQSRPTVQTIQEA
jgi:hypothetical protein